MADLEIAREKEYDVCVLNGHFRLMHALRTSVAARAKAVQDELLIVARNHRNDAPISRDAFSVHDDLVDVGAFLQEAVTSLKDLFEAVLGRHRRKDANQNREIWEGLDLARRALWQMTKGLDDIHDCAEGLQTAVDQHWRQQRQTEWGV